ncbi:MAG: ribonuclease Y [candidate division WWE3 bacterium]|nr:ribonuclease Y [candidate division WWE3 bacterium]
MTPLLLIAAMIAAAVLSAVIIYLLLSKKLATKESGQATQPLSAPQPSANAPLSVNARDIVLSAQEEAFKVKRNAEEEASKIRQKLFEDEKRISGKQEEITKKLEGLEEKEQNLISSQRGVNKKLEEIERLRQEQITKLESVAGTTREEARRHIISTLESSLTDELGRKIRESEDTFRTESKAKAQQILVEAMQHASTDYVAEYTTSVVKLPDEEMKGRIIGREGRNIKAFEQQTGVNIDLDETPGQLRISCFDPVRREVARLSLERLMADGRIQPAKIEEIVLKTQKEIEKIMLEAGEDLCHRIGVYNLPVELVTALGRFKFRFSYGQNMIEHTLEETKMGVYLATELGLDVNIVKLGCLLHDIGKVVTDEEGSHVGLGVDLARKYKLPEKVIACIAEHHEDKPFSSLESVICYISDAMSGSRPGARVEDYGAYLKRMRDLEGAALSFPGVEKAFAISAGREVRVMVKPEEVNDNGAAKMAHDIASKIEKEQVYPGIVKVTVIRELRSSEVAK